MKKACLTIGVVFLSVFAGCGYTTRSTLPSSLRTIHVPSFENQISYTTDERQQTYFPLIEVKTRNAIADRFLFDGNLKIASAETADLYLKGVLKKYEKRVLRYTDNDDVQEYRVSVTVELEMTNRKTGEVMWTEPSFSGEATYFLTGSLATSEESAVEAAIEDLARRVVERTVEDW